MKSLELKLPPPLVVIGCGALMWYLTRIAPSLSVSIPGQSAGITVLLLGALAIGMAGVLALRRARTTILPHHPERASALVTKGVYRYSRNPMYLAMLLVLTAWALHLANAAALVAISAFVGWMNRFQIAPEERALRTCFGTAFVDYERAVRRWI